MLIINMGDTIVPHELDLPRPDNQRIRERLWLRRSYLFGLLPIDCVIEIDRVHYHGGGLFEFQRGKYNPFASSLTSAMLTSLVKTAPLRFQCKRVKK